MTKTRFKSSKPKLTIKQKARLAGKAFAEIKKKYPGDIRKQAVEFDRAVDKIEKSTSQNTAVVYHSPDGSESTVFIKDSKKVIIFEEDENIEDFWRKIDTYALSKNAKYVEDYDTGEIHEINVKLGRKPKNKRGKRKW